MRLPAPVQRLPSAVWRGGAASVGDRTLAEETAIAFTYHGASQAVMMASPADLEDFAIGFSLTEQIITAMEDIAELDIVGVEQGIDLRIWLKAARVGALQARRRRQAGPVGCGLCGLESLAEANRAIPRVLDDLRVTEAAIQAALTALTPMQTLNLQTRAVHAAGFWQAGRPMLVREDVGRHNALDKLAGAMAREGIAGGAGMVVLTSRVSVEMVQKTAIIGAPVLVAVSAPTALAVRTAAAAGITLVGIARPDGFEVFSHPERIQQPVHVTRPAVDPGEPDRS